VEGEEEKTEEEKEEDVEEEEHAQICSHIKYFSIHLFYIVMFCPVLSYVFSAVLNPYFGAGCAGSFTSCAFFFRICSTCREHFPVLSSFTTYYRVFN
jgi:hypothetical protein